MADNLTVSNLEDVLLADFLKVKVDLSELDTIENNHPRDIKLSISDLADVLAALKEVTKPYQLGIQLKICSSELDEIEKNHPKDIDRQKTEVIKYWLHNSPDASWTTLANAVERMGGHARLAEGLREKEQNEESMQPSASRGIHSLIKRISFCVDRLPPRPSTSYSLDTCLLRNVLLLGKRGHGKSTLGNRILDRDGWFKVNDQQCPQTTKGSSMLKSASQLKDYKIQIYDHTGLFEGASSIDTLYSDISDVLHLVIFVLKQGCRFDESKVNTIISKWQISEISALVLTHCERLSEKERGEMIEQFKKDHPSVAELMGKGILAVGFPDSSHIQSGSELSQRVEDDRKELRHLI